MSKPLLKQLIQDVIEENTAQTNDYQVKFTVESYDERGIPHDKTFIYNLKFCDMYQALDYITNTPYVLAPNQKISKLWIKQSSFGTHHHNAWE